MRADARRNRDAVLDAAAGLLSDRPAASMQEIADASGVGRATVYRHFPAREDLVAALMERVGEDIAGIVDRTLREPGDAEAVLRAIAREGVTIGRRWSFLARVTDDGPPAEQLEATDAAFREWIVAAQARGELAPADPAWISAAINALIMAATDTIADPAAAAGAVGDAVVAAFAAAPR